MSTKVHKFMSGFMPTADNTVFELPVGVYATRVDQFGNFFLEPTSVPENPSKVYGEDTEIRAERYLSTFMDTPGKSMGALLIGEPGSGKTMLMRKIINEGLRQGVSVIMVENGFSGANFNKFIHESLRDTSAIVAMDEFEKMYNMNDDEVLAPLLTLFDGPNDSHKMFLCSANNRNQIAEPFFNRPSRFYFMAEFGNLADDVIREYIHDHLIHKHLEGELFTKLVGMDKVNFDCLATSVKEVNRCGNVDRAFMDLNVKEKYSSDTVYALFRVVDKNTGIEYAFNPDNCFRPVHDSAVVYVPKNRSEHRGMSEMERMIDVNDLNHDENTKFNKTHHSVRAYVDRSVAPTREDGCYVFTAKTRASAECGELNLRIFIKNTSKMFAF